MRPHEQSRPSSTSRRRFLQTSAATLGTGLALSQGIARSAHAAGDDTLKIGLVGCGGRGAGAAANALDADPNTKLVAVGDAFGDVIEQRLELLKQKYPDRVVVDREHCFGGFDAYEKVIASGVDVVILATPPHFRPQHLKACVEADKHVFVEKPVAVDSPGVKSILATCEEAKNKGLSVVSGLCFRFNTGIQETMKRVHGGAIGDVVAVQETYNCGPPWFRNKDRQTEWTEMEYQMRNWYVFTWLSGDHNVEQHVHSLDKGAWALNQEVPKLIWGTGGRQVRSEITIGHIYDHHCVTYEFASGKRLYSHCRRMAGCANETSDIFLGTKGTCDLMKNRIEGEAPWRFDGPKNNHYVAEHEALFQSIRNGTPLNHGDYMTHSTMMAIAGRMATYTGKALTWDQAVNSQEDLTPEKYTWDANPPILPNDDGSYPIAVPGVTKFF
jgi:predicted dehydrogenase